MRADRLLSILLLLQSRGRMTAAQLAARLEVSERTIYRDLDALSAAGVPVYAERGPNGGCALVEGYRTTLTGLSEQEIHSLFISASEGPLGDLGLDDVLQAAVLKLLAALPSAQRLDAERVRQCFMLDAAGWFRAEEPVPHLPTLQTAVWQDLLADLVYVRRDGSVGARRIAPYGLVAKASIWYLVAATDEGMRTYRVSRVREVTLTGQHFTRPGDFDLGAYWRAWCAAFEASLWHYRVVLRFAPEIVPVLPQTFGEGIFRLAEQAIPDEEGWIALPITFDTFESARSMVLGFGSLVEVIEPGELRAGVIEAAARIVAFYETRESERAGQASAAF